MQITKFYARDQRAMTALANCGYVPLEHLKQDGLRDKRINNYIKDNICTKERVYDANGTYQEALKLTDVGRKLATKLYDITDFQHAASIEHDSKLSAIYHTLTDLEREDWKNESQLRREFEEMLEKQSFENTKLIEEMRENNKIAVADACYNNTLIEVTTSNYHSAEIEMHDNYAEIVQLDINYY